MVSAADKAAKTNLLWDKDIIPWLISQQSLSDFDDNTRAI
jgi:hypothetical protein